MNKYRNYKVSYNGVKFDSKKELHRWHELSLLEKAGEITELDRQVKFELIPAQYRTVETGDVYKRGPRAGEPKTKEVCIEKACVYYADFVYRKDGRQVVEDTKSKATRTEAYIIKRKLMLHLYGIKIQEV